MELLKELPRLESLVRWTDRSYKKRGNDKVSSWKAVQTKYFKQNVPFWCSSGVCTKGIAVPIIIILVPTEARWEWHCLIRIISWRKNNKIMRRKQRQIFRSNTIQRRLMYSLSDTRNQQILLKSEIIVPTTTGRKDIEASIIGSSVFVIVVNTDPAWVLCLDSRT